MNLANLETTLTHSNRKVPKTFNFKAGPDKVVALADANIRIVNLANNHVLDFDEEGFFDTLKTLDAAGIKFVGAGKDDAAATKPFILSLHGISLGILGFTDNEPTWKAGAARPGVNYIDIGNQSDRDNALASISRLKKQAHIVIVTIHWGPNMKAFPDRSFIEFAHAMIEHGASLIHGHSAHNFQGVEVYRQKLIFYDTGDFIDDYVVHPELRNDHSFFFRVELNREGLMTAKLIPVRISHCQVNQATTDDQRWNIRRMQSLSARLGTTITDSGDVLLAQKQLH
jgi:poly-gamma-glutamate synthesis protein (capsule biosynthesis protein)